MVLGVTQVLEQRYGMRRTAVAELGSQLQESPSGPRLVNRRARLAVTVDPAVVEYLNESAAITEGLVVAFGPLFEKVDQYLSFDAQLSLQFGPALVAHRYA